MSNIIVTDTETGSLDCAKGEILQIAAVVINGNTLELNKTDEFCSLMQPTDFTKLEPKAMEINKITVASLEAAPAQKQVWQMYCDFINKYKTGSKQWDAPILAGHNVGFDVGFMQKLAEKYGPIDDMGKLKLFHPRDVLDTKVLTRYWFWDFDQIKSSSLDNLRDYFGMKDNTGLNRHDALRDCRDTAKILIRLLKLAIKLREKITFKGAFTNEL